MSQEMETKVENKEGDTTESVGIGDDMQTRIRRESSVESIRSIASDSVDSIPNRRRRRRVSSTSAEPGRIRDSSGIRQPRQLRAMHYSYRNDNHRLHNDNNVFSNQAGGTGWTNWIKCACSVSCIIL